MKKIFLLFALLATNVSVIYSYSDSYGYSAYDEWSFSLDTAFVDGKTLSFAYYYECETTPSRPDPWFQVWFQVQSPDGMDDWELLPNKFIDIVTYPEPHNKEGNEKYVKKMNIYFRLSAPELFGNNYESLLGGIVRFDVIENEVIAYNRSPVGPVSIPITQACPEISSTSVQNVTCAGANNGQLVLNLERNLYENEKLHVMLASTSNPDLNELPEEKYSLSDNVLIIDNLKSDFYKLFISSSRKRLLEDTYYSLYGTSRWGYATISEPDSVRVTAQKSDAVCYDDLGSLQLTATGGTQADYILHYRKHGSDYLEQAFVFPENAITIPNLTAGIYDYYVTDGNHCASETHSVEIRQPNEAMAIVDVVNQNATGQGRTDGEIQFSVQGGYGNHQVSYQFEMQNYALEPVEPNTYRIIGAAGDYQVRIVDSSGCAYSETFTIVDIPSLTAFLEKSQSINCHGDASGQLVVHVREGVPTYSYQWLQKTGEIYSELTGENDSIIQNLPAGMYSVKILDSSIPANDTTLYYTLTEPELLTTTLSSQDVTHFEASDGWFRIAVKGGTKNYTLHYRQANEDPFLDMQTNVGDSVFLLSNLPKATYQYYVTDKNDCRASDFLESITIRQPSEPLIVSLENTDTISCYGETSGVLMAHVRGGIPSVTATLPYHYQWYKMENDHPVWLTNHTDSILRNLPAGAYQVKITDYEDPTNRVESEIFTISQPNLLTTNWTMHNISCYGFNDGFIRIGVSGGVGNYRLFYQQENVDTDYQEQAIDPAENTFTLENLVAGQYTAFILDDNNCYAKINGEDIHTITLSQPDAPLAIASVVKTDVSGYGRSDGNIVLRIDGGTPKDDNTYSIEWRDANDQLLSSPENLSAGIYSVLITDKNGCSVADTYTLTQPEPLTGNIEETHFVSCFENTDGQLVARAQGGVQNPNVNELPYQYTWYKETAAGLFEAYHPTPDTQPSEQLNNMSAGNYRVIIEDYSRVTNTITLDYTLTQPELLTATATQTDVYCGGTTAISVEVQGGTLPYRYRWATGEETAVVQNVGAGVYPVRVMDANGCETTASAIVTTPSDLEVNGLVHHPICFEADNGWIELQVSGGSAPYRYLWNTGETTQNLSNVPAGGYFVTVTDVHDCSYFRSFVLENPAPLQVYIGEDRTLCNGQQLTLAPMVEDSQTRFAWTGPNQFAAQTSSVTVNQAGTYHLTITDSKGCQATDSLQVFLKNLDINSEIVVANHIFVNDTILIVNVSTPEPDRNEWLFNDSDPVIVFENQPHYTKVMFTETGSFSIGHRTYVDHCYQDDFRTLTVVEAENRDTSLYGESIVNKFIVYPNPNHGQFSISVELNKVSPIRLRIFDLTHGLLVNDRRETGKEHYVLNYDLSLVAGSYVLLLETPSGNLNSKMIAY